MGVYFVQSSYLLVILHLKWLQGGTGYQLPSTSLSLVPGEEAPTCFGKCADLNPRRRSQTNDGVADVCQIGSASMYCTVVLSSADFCVQMMDINK